MAPIRFAARMDDIQVSGIRAVFDQARQIPDAIDLSIGQGDFEVPEPVREATVAAIRAGCGRYSATQGFADVVEAARAHLRAHHSLPDSDAVMMTSGATGALNLALMTLAGPGDEVLLPDPFFVLYQTLVRMVGAEPTYYDLYPDFELRPETIERALTDRTRAVLINSPANPTGAALSAEALETIAALCARRGVVVISDELYAPFSYDAPHTTIKRFGQAASLLVGGLSKSHGMAGWRLGWAAGPPALIDKMRTLQQFLYACPPTLVQRGALAAFEVDVSPQVARYRRKRDLIYDGLRAAGYEVVRPAGSFFIFPKVPRGWSDVELYERAIARKVVVVPGRAFSRRDTHFRICFGVADALLERAVEAFAEIIEGP